MGIVNVGSTLGGMAGGAATARLLVVISGQTHGLTQALSQSERGLAGFSRSANQVGNAMIRGVTLPVMALGGASLKMAADYESAMARVSGLTTATADQVVRADERILEMAKRVPTAPTELADSLYFAASAGLPFQTAMQIVEASAKAAAIGMGEANDIAKILIFSMNAYGDTGLTVGRAMDVFAKAIQIGTADPDELTLALGRLLPVAKEAGITFETTVASIASLTNIGLPTRVAATSLRALFGGLMAPTQQAMEQLDKLGLSSDDLRDALESGPLVAFELLEKATGGNEDQMRKLIPQIRAITAHLGLSGERANEAARAFRQTANATGTFDKAFAAIEETKAFQFSLAINELRVAAIEFGRVLFPVFTQIIGVVSAFAEGLSALPAGAKQFVVAAALIAAAGGPLLKLYAALTNGGVGLMSNWRAVGTGAFVMVGGIAAAVAGFNDLAAGTGGAGAALTTFIGTLLAAKLAFSGIQAAANAGMLGVNAFSVGLATMAPGWGTLIAGGLAVGVTALAYFMGKQDQVRQQSEELSQALVDAGSNAQLTAKFFRDLGDSRVNEMFQQAAQSAGQMGVSLSKGLGPAQTQLITMFIARLKELRAVAEGSGETSAINVLDKFTGLDELEGKSISLDKAFNRIGASTEDQTTLFEYMGGTASDTSQDLQAIVGASDAVARAQSDLKDIQLAQIASFVDSKRVSKELSQQYGVSAEDVKSAASSMGVDLLGMSDDAKKAFARAMGWTDEFGNTIGGAATKMKAEQDAIAQRQESVSNLLGALFEKDVETVKSSTGAIINSMNAQAKNLASFADNTRTLLSRGMAPEALQFLVDQGPAMVNKFVTASDDELRQFEKNYFISLAAVDQAIVNEGNHQKIKGKANVQKFTQGMLSNKLLPSEAAFEIVGRVTSSMARGDFRGKGRGAIEKYARGLASQLGLTKQQAQLVVKAVLEVTGKAPSATGKHGQATGQQFSTGVRGGVGPATSSGQALAQAVKTPLTSLPAFGASIGAGMASSLSASLTAGIDRAAANVEAKIASLKARTKAAATDSPRYFTYYMGQDLIKDMNEGVKRTRLNTINRPGISTRMRRAGLPSIAGRDGGGVHVTVNAPAGVDKKTVKEMAYRGAIQAIRDNGDSEGRFNRGRG